MMINELKNKAPLVKSWINDLLHQYQGKGQSVAQYNFPNLKNYYDPKILSAVNVIVVDKVPQVPLASLGLTQFSEFEKGDYVGVTYLSTYFITPEYIHRESLHFHELVHVIQWAHLGVDRFILLYGLLLLQSGYRENLLEEMAYRYQALFEHNKCPKDLVAKICTETDLIYNRLSREYSF